MFNAPAHKLRLTGLTACLALAALAAILLLGLLSPGSARPQPAAVEALPSSSPLAEGPGGRTALTRWTLRTDPADRGTALGWQRGGFGGASVSIPNVIDPTRYAGATAQANYEGSIAWYRTTFTAPTAGTYALTFQSANFAAQVWVDGHALGSHRGSYLPFELRDRVAAGGHTLVVRIDWRNPGAQSQQGFHRTWFNWGGLDGEVDVRAIGPSELSDPAIRTTLSPGSIVCVRAPCPNIPAVQAATVTISVQVRNDGASGRAIVPEGSLSRGGQAIALGFPEQRLAHGQTATASATVTIPEPALWSPASPSLYQLTLGVGHECSFSARVGLRQIAWHGGRVYLNGRPLQVHGASVQEDALGHGDALSPGDQNTIVSELRAIGANAVRTQHPLDPELLERLDAAGILVWQGIGPVEGAGNWYSSSPSLLADAENQARTAALADGLHPSILAWNLVDEVAENGRNGAEVSYVQALTHWLHAHDPTRMVAVDIWGDHPPAHPGALYREVDAIAETDYSGWYDNPRNSPTAVSAEISRRLQSMQRTFAGKVLLISEFGAESNGLNPGAAPGGYSFQASLLARHIRAYVADPQLSGMFVYLLRDYPLTPTFQGGSIHSALPRLRLIEGLNQKGLFTYGGRPKQAVGAVARLYRALGAG
ncbi:MAG TPA: glycoside hydrolase family 2 TIM barrel-domain containing protein [Solirubrobacteraceae bacterium]|nr:glycoside hydrolase family 2 TIM barrel-domain containing protein [Solirubrobacteraceae bacterium]